MHLEKPNRGRSLSNSWWRCVAATARRTLARKKEWGGDDVEDMEGEE
jgi:hypothetical protein